jgi:hypothetical protein
MALNDASRFVARPSLSGAKPTWLDLPLFGPGRELTLAV